jgi:hypothetical protein
MWDKLIELINIKRIEPINVTKLLQKHRQTIPEKKTKTLQKNTTTKILVIFY